MAAKDNAQQLIDKYLKGECTEAEKTQVERFYLQQLKEKELPEMDAPHGIKAEMWAHIRTNRVSRVSRVRRLRKWVPYAAAILLVASAVGYFAVISRQSSVDSPVVADIAPGGNRATLTLADGRTIDLSSEQAGIVVADGITYHDGTSVLGGQVNEGISEQVNVGTSEPVQGSERNYRFTSSPVHSLTTPKGGTYQVTLPDGTKVWLNAASTLRYPSRFSGEERVVFLDGEAYFDVRHETLDTRHETPSSAPESHLKSHISSLKSAERPFKVVSNGQTVEVLGTEFNITTYKEEGGIRTALVTGSVKITTDAGESLLLRPGEGALLRVSGQLSKQPIDIESAVAWKNGFFIFDNEPIHSILRKVSRWYDVEIHYKGDVGELSFLGIIPRSENISAVLGRLEKTGDVKFNIDGRRVTVMR